MEISKFCPRKIKKGGDRVASGEEKEKETKKVAVNLEGMNESRSSLVAPSDLFGSGRPTTLLILVLRLIMLAPSFVMVT